MLSLEIENNIVNLVAGQTVSFDINNLIFDTEFIQGSRSSNLRIVNDAIAQDIFGLPEMIASRTKTYSFKPFDATILFNGIVLYKGKFILRKASNFYYEGNFQFAVADLVNFKDKKIAEILGDESYVFEDPNAQFEMDKTLTIANNPVVFPVVKLANKFYNKYKNDTYQLPYKVGDDGQAVPFIKLIFIFELVLKKVGYKIITPNWTESHPDVLKIIFFNNKRLRVNEQVTQETITVSTPKGEYTTVIDAITTTILENLRYGDFLPEMTFGQFLMAVKNMLGLHLDFDSNRKTVAISFFDDIILNNSEAKNITHKVSPKHIVTPYEQSKNLNFAFENYDDDKIFSYLEDYPENLIGYNLLDEVELIAELNPTPPQNAVCFVRSENRYFIKTFEGWQEWCYPWLDYKPFGDTENSTKEIKTAFSPVASNKLWHFINKKGKIRQQDTTSSPNIEIIIDANQIYIKPAWIVFKESEVYENQKRNPVLSDNRYVTRVDKLYRDDEDIAYTRLSEGGFILPESDFAVSENPLPPIRCLIFHGMQESPVALKYNEFDPATPIPIARAFGSSEEGTRFYPMASSEAYDNFGEQINEFALRWEYEFGLIETFWQSFVKIHEQTRRFELEAAFTLEDLRKFQPTQKVQIREAQFIIEKIETKISDVVNFTTLQLLKIDQAISKSIKRIAAEGLKFNGINHCAAKVPSSYYDIRTNFTINIKLSVKNEILIVTESNTVSFFTSLSDYNFVVIPLNYNTEFANWGLSVGTNGVVIWEVALSHFVPIAVYNAPVGVRDNCSVAMVCNQKQASIYIDGDLVHTGQTSIKQEVGCNVLYGNWFFRGYEGIIDEIKVFDKALSPVELTTLSITENTPSSAIDNLQAQYLFKEKTGNIAFDTSGNENHLNLISYTPEQLSLGPENHHVSAEGEAILV